MSKHKDSSAIKLFGQTIPLQTLNQLEASADHEFSFRCADREDCCDANLLSSSDDGVQVLASTDDKESIAKEFIQDDEHETSLLKSSKNEEISDEKTSNSSEEKTNLKKPDKILPCPRCNSKETKFCYYNNYNVNQPRHFCKNCQRYWTAGGTMRNLPVGAGRRKTKTAVTSSALQHYHQIMISEAILAAQASSANILTFGSSGKTQAANVEDTHSGESVITANLEKEGLNKTEDKIYQRFPRPNFPWTNTAMLPPQGFPVSFHPEPAYFNTVVPISPWGVPMASPSPTLRKHSRDEIENIVISNTPAAKLLEIKENKSKTMRIDDIPGETAKSIMLATLVNKSSWTNSTSGGLFEGFQSKISDNERNYRVESLSVLHANPAAMSRSFNFRENT